MTAQFIICESCAARGRCTHWPREWCADYIDLERVWEELHDWETESEWDEPTDSD